jgi:hypothetical protein
MHYVLWVKMHKLQPTKLVDSQIQCIMSIMHYDLIHYEPVNCTSLGKRHQREGSNSDYSMEPQSPLDIHFSGSVERTCSEFICIMNHSN